MSPVHEVLVEQSVIGWKEFELEVMRDGADNFVVICSIENIDPMGVHTGDSITVAPALTLTDKEYQRMRDAARRIIRRVGVETGGSNIQFAINPADGRMVAIEMNPRVSRSSALASKATGFPIAKIAAKLALGYRLDEIKNDITRIDAGLVRADDRLRRREGAALGVREVPAGRSDADDADEIGRRGDGHRPHVQGSLSQGVPIARARQERAAVRPEPIPASRTPTRTRPRCIRRWRFRPIAACGRSSGRSSAGGALDELHRITHIDPWFLTQFQQIVELARQAEAVGARDLSDDLLRDLKRAGFADADLGRLIGDGRGQCAGPAPRDGHRAPPTSASIPAPPSSSPTRRTCTARSKPSASRTPRRSRKSSFSAADRTGSGRASSSTTAAVMRHSRCATAATRP